MDSRSEQFSNPGWRPLHPRAVARRARGRENLTVLVLGALDPRTRRLLALAGVALLVIIEIDDVLRRHPRGAALTVLATATLLVAGAWLVNIGWPDRWPVPVAATLAAGTLALQLTSPAGGAVIGAIITLSVIARLPEPLSGPAAIAMIFAYLAAFFRSTNLSVGPALATGLGLAFAYLAFRSRTAQLEAAALNERSRIAREIHDVLAHTLAALAVQLEGARVVLEREHAPSAATAAVERAHKLAREGLEETRRAVSALRGDRIPGLEQLRHLVADFEHDTRIPVKFDLQGEPGAMSSEAQLAIYRAAQEALTNIRRHARAQKVTVALHYRDRGAELEIVDAGEAPPVSSTGGYGLTGMRERAELLGGRVEAAPTADGFRVHLWLPA